MNRAPGEDDQGYFISMAGELCRRDECGSVSILPGPEVIGCPERREYWVWRMKRGHDYGCEARFC